MMMFQEAMLNLSFHGLSLHLKEVEKTGAVGFLNVDTHAIPVPVYTYRYISSKVYDFRTQRFWKPEWTSGAGDGEARG
jgi:hypothetical protein